MKIILKREFYLSEWKEVKEELLKFFSVLERIDKNENGVKKYFRNKVIRNVGPTPIGTLSEAKSRYAGKSRSAGRNNSKNKTVENE